MTVDKIRMRLNMFKIKKRNVIVTLKSKKTSIFNAEVLDFSYEEDDTKVLLKKIDSSFPFDENERMFYVKNIEDVQQIKSAI